MKSTPAVLFFLIITINILLPNRVYSSDRQVKHPAQQQDKKMDPTEGLAEEFFKTKNQLVNGEEKQRELLAKIYDINQNLKKLVGDRSKIEQKKQHLEFSTKDLAQKIIDLNKKIDEQKNRLQNRLQALSRLGQSGPAQLLFSSTNPANLDRNLKILSLISKYDMALIHGYSTMTKSLAEQQKKFLNRLAAIQRTKKDLEQKEGLVQKDVQKKLHLLSDARKGKGQVIDRLRFLRSQLKKRTDLAEDEFVNLLLQPSFAEIKGQMLPPVQGHVLHKFGVWKDPDYNVALKRKGLLYDIVGSQVVTAVFSGSVAFVDEIPGRGQTLIVDHGDHYYSIYSGPLLIDLQKGDPVKTGQKIARVEKNLYFEVRHFSEPSDPNKWLKGQVE